MYIQTIYHWLELNVRYVHSLELGFPKGRDAVLWGFPHDMIGDGVVAFSAEEDDKSFSRSRSARATHAGLWSISGRLVRLLLLAVAAVATFAMTAAVRFLLVLFVLKGGGTTASVSPSLVAPSALNAASGLLNRPVLLSFVLWTRQTAALNKASKGLLFQPG
jgi:hypothetical protein